jgi:hypothetical protein
MKLSKLSISLLILFSPNLVIAQETETKSGQQICLYKNTNYSGDEHCYEIGEKIDLIGNPNNDQFSSARVPSGLLLRYYKNSSFSDERFTKVDIADFGTFDNEISSFEVERYVPETQVCFYTQNNYSGEERCYDEGANVVLWGVNDSGGITRSRLDNKFRSVRLGANLQVTTYDKSYNESGALPFLESRDKSSDLRHLSQISAFKVEKLTSSYR